MRGPIVVNDRITIPASAIETRAIRSSGPGGQNVNKVASKIQMRIALEQIIGFAGDELARARAFLSSRLDAEGRLLVSSQATRDQARNVEDAAAKAAQLIRASLLRPKTRRRTRPTYASVRKRIDAKRHRSRQLRDRGADEG